MIQMLVINMPIVGVAMYLAIMQLNPGIGFFNQANFTALIV